MKILFLTMATFILFGGITTNLLFQRSCSSATSRSTNITGQTATAQKTSNGSDIRQWIAPTYLGLKLGESTGDDVRRLFGKPKDESPNRDEDKVFDKDAENEIVLDYDNPNGANGSVVVILGKKTRIVKAISIYPNDKITMQEAISKFGPAFFQNESWLSNCIGEQQKPGILDESMAIPFVLVYPNLGLLVDIRKHNDDFTVGRIDYLMKCG